MAKVAASAGRWQYVLMAPILSAQTHRSQKEAPGRLVAIPMEERGWMNQDQKKPRGLMLASQMQFQGQREARGQMVAGQMQAQRQTDAKDQMVAGQMQVQGQMEARDQIEVRSQMVAGQGSQILARVHPHAPMEMSLDARMAAPHSLEVGSCSEEVAEMAATIAVMVQPAKTSAKKKKKNGWK
jgi:hypothetical protein